MCLIRAGWDHCLHLIANQASQPEVVPDLGMSDPDFPHLPNLHPMRARLCPFLILIPDWVGLGQAQLGVDTRIGQQLGALAGPLLFPYSCTQVPYSPEASAQSGLTNPPKKGQVSTSEIAKRSWSPTQRSQGESR
jgi:hypothetical protein